MRSSVNSYFAWLLYLLFLISVSSLMDNPSTETKYESCGTRPYITNGNYERTLNSLLRELAENIATAPTLFAVSSRKANNATVYGLAQCEGYLQPSQCKQCVSAAAQNVLHTCKTTYALIEFRGCYLRYDERQWYFLPKTKGALVACNSQNATDSTFSCTLPQIISNVTRRAYTSTGFANASYALSEIRVYALAHCINYRSPMDAERCRSCLSFATKSLQLCGQKSIGGRAIARQCFIRYEVYDFFSTVDAQLATSFHGRYRRSKVAVMSGSLAASAVLCVFMVVICRLLIRKFMCERSALFRGKGGVINPILSRTKLDRKLYFNYKVLRTATGNFQLTNLLGKGAFGTVYKGILPNGTEVAVKKLFSGSARGEIDFFNEVHVISVVQHRNLVKLFGCSVHGLERLLVYEYLPNRSLDQILFDNERSHLLDWGRRKEIILGIGRGLTYLHEECETRIIHRDIKACNILLDDNFRPKIADFGLARLIAEDESHITTRIAGTPGYIAPEYALNGQLTEKADIFSFGVVCLEILTGERCTTIFVEEDTRVQSFLEKVWTLYMAGNVLTAMDSNLGGRYLEGEAMQAFHVALVCTQASPTLRRRMSDVVSMLSSSHREELPLPTKPEFIHLDDRQHHSHDNSASTAEGFRIQSSTFQTFSSDEY